MKKLIILSLSALLTLAGCSTTTSTIVTEVSRTGNVMLDLREDYELARYQLDMSIDNFPTETGVQLLTLEEEIQVYIDEVQRLWKFDQLSTVLAIDAIYYEGAELYNRGVVLITPHIDTLEPAAQEQLRALAISASRVDETYHKLRKDLRNATRQTEMAQQSIELMTLLLRLSVLSR